MKKWDRDHPEKIREYKKKWEKRNKKWRKEYVKVHTNKIRLYKQKWYKKNFRKIKLRATIYYRKHRNDFFERARKRYLKKRDEIRTYSRNYRLKRLKKYKKYIKLWKTKNPEAVKRHRDKYPKKEKARATLQRAVRKGLIIKKPCQRCGSKKIVHGHHFDYSKPLKVIWLCPSCHAQYHHFDLPWAKNFVHLSSVYSQIQSI